MSDFYRLEIGNKKIHYLLKGSINNKPSQRKQGISKTDCQAQSRVLKEVVLPTE